MKNFRKVLFWCHLVMGVSAGIVVFMMSVTGVLLTYERQMTLWADTRNLAITPPAEGRRRSASELLAAARAAKPDAQPTALTFRAAPDAPASVSFGRAGSLYVNPYTGEVLGAGATGVRDFFHVVTDLHRWLALSDASRPVGRAVTGAANLIFFFIVLSGLYLWLPRIWTRKSLRHIGWFKRGLSGKARDFNWHNVIGIWCLLPMALIVLSGVTLSYVWAGNLVYRIVGETPPPPQQRGPTPNASAKPNATDGLDVLLNRAAQHSTGWQTLTMQLPNAPDAPVTFALDKGNGGQPQARATLTLARANGEVVRYETFADASRGRKLRSFFRFAHTGEYFGLVGQTIAGLVSLGGALLVWTGLALAWRRFRAWRNRRQTATGLA